MSYLTNHRGRIHDRIQRDLERKLSKYIKKEFRGQYWTLEHDGNYPWSRDELIKTEERINGNLPSGKDYCRVDLGLHLDDDYAFEINTSKSDLKNYPEQANDYRSAGYRPVLVTTVDVFTDNPGIIPVVTGSDNVIAEQAEFFFSLEKEPPALSNHFTTESLADGLYKNCPQCGWTGQYIGSDSCFCDACSWSVDIDI